MDDADRIDRNQQAISNTTTTVIARCRDLLTALTNDNRYTLGKREWPLTVRQKARDVMSSARTLEDTVQTLSLEPDDKK
jgi:hypothetical protein